MPIYQFLQKNILGDNRCGTKYPHKKKDNYAK